MKRVKCIDSGDCMGITLGNIYQVAEEDGIYYRVVNDFNEVSGYLYRVRFEEVEENEGYTIEELENLLDRDVEIYDEDNKIAFIFMSNYGSRFDDIAYNKKDCIYEQVTGAVIPLEEAEKIVKKLNELIKYYKKYDKKPNIIPKRNQMLTEIDELLSDEELYEIYKKLVNKKY